MAKKRGFTLVEALVVVILIAIGAALAFSFYDEVVVEGREKAAAAYAIDSARTIGEAAQAYYLRTGNQVIDPQILVDSGDLKAVPDPTKLLAEAGIPGLLAAAHAENALVYKLGLDNTYKLDGTPDGVDGYVDIQGLTNGNICGKINEKIGKSDAVVQEQETSVPATQECPSGLSLVGGQCEGTPSCASGTLNSSTDKCEGTTTSTYAATAQEIKATFNQPVYEKPVDAARPKALYAYNNSGAVLKGYVAYGSSVPELKQLYGYDLGYLSPLGNITTPVYNWGKAVMPTDATLSGAIPVYLPASPSGSINGILYFDSAKGPLFGYISPTSGEKVVKTTYSCTAGDTLSGSQCTHSTPTQSNPICASGSYDASSDKCVDSLVVSCPDGFTRSGDNCLGAVPSEGYDPETDHLLTTGTYCYAAGDGTYTFHYPFAVQ